MLAVKVNELVDLVAAGLNAAVTPLGSPDAVRFTLPLNPFWSFTLILLVALAPARRARLPDDDERLKFAGAVTVAAVTVSMTVVLPERAPELPVTVTLYFPGATALFAAKVNELVEEVVVGLNTAVIPLGSPDAVRFTLPLNPFWSFTLMVLVALAPATRARLPDDDERLKFAGAVTVGSVTVSTTAVLLERVPEVPVTVTV